MGSTERRLGVYLQLKPLTTLSNLLGLFPWFFMILSLKQVSHRTFQQLAHCISAARVKHLLNNTSHRTLSPCRSLTFLPNVAIESN